MGGRETGGREVGKEGGKKGKEGEEWRAGREEKEYSPCREGRGNNGRLIST